MIAATTKAVVRSRYVMRCGYCGVTETQTGATLTFDHFQPRDAGGTDDAGNLVYACHACNEYKGAYWSVDADTRLLHPLDDDLTLHLHEDSDGKLIGDTPLGTVYIERLRLNRAPLVAHRAEQTATRNATGRRAEEAATLERLLQEVRRGRRKRRVR